MTIGGIGQDTKVGGYRAGSKVTDLIHACR